VQIGADHRLAPNVSLNLDIRWNRLRFDLTELDADAVDVRVDPLAIGLGLRFGL
jgi:outer membrane protein W